MKKLILLLIIMSSNLSQAKNVYNQTAKLEFESMSSEIILDFDIDGEETVAWGYVDLDKLDNFYERGSYTNSLNVRTEKRRENDRTCVKQKVLTFFKFISVLMVNRQHRYSFTYYCY